MEKSVFSVLTFQNYIVERILFEINRDFEPEKEPIGIEFSMTNNYTIQDDKAIVSLECFVFKDPKKNKPFSLEVKITGFYEFEGEVSNETQKSLLKVNATAILYPYLRSLVSMVTSNSGFPPVILPTINVSKFIAESESATKLES